MARHLTRGFAALLGVMAIVAVAVVATWTLVAAKLDPKPETILAASLQGLQEQNRLSTFAARFVAVVTSQEMRFGLSARKTLIMPGAVRYEVDMAKLSPRDLRWNAASKTLFVTLPPVEVTGPEIDMTQIREYDAGGLLMALTDAEAKLDAANRRAGQAELVRQAREPVTMTLARDATRRAVERNFALPLSVAGLDTHVEARFADEDKPRSERWDTSRTLEEVLSKR